MAFRLGLLLVCLFAARCTTVVPVVPVHGVQDARVHVEAGGAGHLLKAAPLGFLRSTAARQVHTTLSR